MKKVITIILSILLVIMILVTSFLMCIRNFLTKQTINDTITNLNYENISLRTDEDFSSMFDDIYDIADEYDINREVIDEFIDKEITPTLPAEIMGNITSYIIDAYDSKILSDNYIDKISNSLVNYVLKHAGVDLGVYSSTVSNLLSNQIRSDMSDIPHVSEYNLGIDERDLSIFRFIISNTILYILIFIIIILIGLIIILSLNKLHFIIPLFISLLVSGILLGVGPMILLSIIDITDVSNGIMIYILINLFYLLLKNILNTAYIFIGISIIGIIVYIIGNKITQKNKSIDTSLA